MTLAPPLGIFGTGPPASSGGSPLVTRLLHAVSGASGNYGQYVAYLGIAPYNSGGGPPPSLRWGGGITAPPLKFAAGGTVFQNGFAGDGSFFAPAFSSSAVTWVATLWITDTTGTNGVVVTTGAPQAGVTSLGRLYFSFNSANSTALAGGDLTVPGAGGAITTAAGGIYIVRLQLEMTGTMTP